MKEKIFFNPVKKISKNKTLELQSGIWKYWSYFDFRISADRHTDHAGFYFDIQIFGLYFIFQIYDNRHWNFEKDEWQKPRSTIFKEDGGVKFVAPGISVKESA